MNGLSPHAVSFTLLPSHLADEQQPARFFDTDNMKVEIRWENAEKNIIRYTFSGVWDWDDFYRVVELCAREPLSEDVYLIVDFRAISLAPSDAILHLKRAAKMAETRSSPIVLISSSATIATLYQAFVTMYKTVGKRMRIVSSDEEALALLDALRRIRG